MEAQAAFVGAYSAVALHAEAAVDMHLPAVIHPGNAEDDDALRLHNALQDFLVHELRVLGHIRGYTFHHLADGLVEFVFTGVAGYYLAHEPLDVIAGEIVHRFFSFYVHY